MASPRALIVDDSRTAQARLKKLLGRYDIQVDTATSAEQALSYLTYQVPVVVFMDHMMSGMDGFEALRVIKSNPETATIPVVMYTSKSGDLYLGQARALGAVGVLSKDGMKSSSLEPVLASLKLRKVNEAATNSEGDVELVVEPVATASVSAVTAPAERIETPRVQLPSVDAVEGIRKQVAKSLEMNISSVRHEISEVERVLSSRLVREFNDVRGLLKAMAEKPPVTAPVDIIEPVADSKGGVGIWGGLLLASVLFLSAFSAYSLQKMNAAEKGLLETAEQLRIYMGDEVERQATAESVSGSGVGVEALLNALAWSFNQVGQVPFSQDALSANQLSLFTGLVHHLNQSGFQGDVVVELRRGDFCVNFDEEGAVALAGSEDLQTQCTLLSDYSVESAGEAWLSQEFNNFANNSPVFADGEISLVVQEYKFDDPYYQYPAITSANLAGDWNEVAALNNRVDIRLISLDQ